MPFEISDLADLSAASFDAIIDVRSPAEFAQDHVPGAINLPVLSNEERANVGTIYTQESPFLARKIGAAIVARNAASHIEGPLADKDGGWRPLVYCWRGGQRSGSFASILQQIGWRAEVLSGGYQSYRREVVRRLYELPVETPLVLLDGNTGTAKTEILARLAKRGAQTIDLEGFANHRGSALGGQGEQPSQKGFESLLASALGRVDPTKPILVEAESSKIGNINLPPRFFEAMRKAPRIVIESSVSARATYLARAYADVLEDRNAFIGRLDLLAKLQGWERVAAWKALVSEGRFAEVAADLIERHYDPRYAKARERVGAEVLQTVYADKLDDAGIDDVVVSVEKVLKQSLKPMRRAVDIAQ